MVVGPSGVGKGTLVAAAARRVPDLFVSVSATTRPPRAGEVDGVSYHFLTPARFDALIAQDGLLEWAQYAGTRYGTPRRPVSEALAHHRPVLLEIELAGARQVRARMPEAVLVFIAPPSWETLRDRLVRRGTESPERIAARLEVARTELAAQGEFDHVVVNDELETAVDHLVELINGPTAGPALDPGRAGRHDSAKATRHEHT